MRLKDRTGDQYHAKRHYPEQKRVYDQNGAPCKRRSQGQLSFRYYLAFFQLLNGKPAGASRAKRDGTM